MLNELKSTVLRTLPGIREPNVADSLFARLLQLQGSTASLQVRRMDRINTLADVEFSVFSQWGEDGIIDWLIAQNGDMPEIFVEFGVETYRESNTRFLAANRNWRGLIIDGSDEKINVAREDQISWRHDIASVAAFITEDNINALITGAGISGEIGILSVDIDGNDYWVWKAIDTVNPHFVIAEYNGQFGDLLPLSVPYRPDFFRTDAHFSNLYYGASIKAFEQLADEKGYTLLGSNMVGTNAFFIRNDRLAHFDGKIGDRRARPSRVREGRDENGQLSFVRGSERVEVIADQPVTNVVTSATSSLREHGPLFSEWWQAAIEGRIAPNVAGG